MSDESSHDVIEAYRRAVNPARLEMIEAGEIPRVFEEAEGAWVTSGGRRYLDMICGWGTATLGHHPQPVMRALTEALASTRPLTNPVGISPDAGRLAAKLCELAEGKLEKVYFGNSGTEGIEAALKFAMAKTQRDAFIHFSESFHGFSLGALSLCGADAWRSPFQAQGVTALRAPFADVDAIESWLAARPVAAVVAEVVQGMAGARPWPTERLRAVADQCHRHGALLILDEILTGVGRTGEWFAYQHAGLSPDIVVVSKGLTGGAVPMSAVLMTDDVYWAVFRGRPGIHSSTFEANLLAMTAGLATLRTIEDQALLPRVGELAKTFEKRLQERRDRDIGVTDVRVNGLLIGLEIGDQVRDGELWGAPALQKRLLERGVLVRVAAQAPSWLQLLPPFNLADSESDFFFERLDSVLVRE